MPEDIELTAGPAAFHRQFLDLYISQFSRRYLDDLIAYRKVLLQRNKLLKDISRSPNGISQLQAWDNLLIEHGTRITSERLDFVRSIGGSARMYYSRFDKSGELALQYKPKLENDRIDIKAALRKSVGNLPAARDSGRLDIGWPASGQVGDGFKRQIGASL